MSAVSLCSDCPPFGYNEKTRCEPCPRRDFCSYPSCKCIVQTSTSQPVPECKKGLQIPPKVPFNDDPLAQAKVMTVNSGRKLAIERAEKHLRAQPAKAEFWNAVINHLKKTAFD